MNKTNLKTNSNTEQGDIWIDVTRCTLCKICIDACPVSAIKQVPDGIIQVELPDGSLSWLTEGYMRIAPEECIQCEQCIPVCAYDAINDEYPARNGGYPGPEPDGPHGGGGSQGNGSISTRHFVASGSNTSAYDIASLMMTAFGLSASHAEIAANAAALEATATSAFKLTSRVFGSFDIATNMIEFAESPNWEDAGQITLGIMLTFGTLNPATAIVGGIILAGWELYEYKRDHK